MKHPIRRRALFGLFCLGSGLAYVLPLGFMRAAGRLIGNVAFFCAPSVRRLMDQHLAYAFGHALSAGQRRSIARAVIVNLSQTVVEWLCMPKLSAADLQKLIRVEGLDHLRQAVAQGKGVLACSAHFGNWEFIATYLRTLGFDGALLARRLRYPEYEAFLIKMRAQKGVPTHERGSVKEVARLLRANKIVGFMPDQDTDGLEGVFVDFFGHPAYTPAGPAALSLMTGAAIVPCFMIRDGRGFRLVFEPAVSTPSTTDRKEAILQLTQAWSHVMESYIRRYPEQWVWMHRRWKTTPESLAKRLPVTNGPSGPPGAQMRTPLAALATLAGGLLLTMSAGCQGSRDKEAAKSNEAAQTQAANPDQQLDTFTLTGYDDDGRRRWDLQGTEASLENNIVTIQKPNGVGYDAERRAYLTAKTAEVDQRTRNILLQEDVTVHTSDGVWFTAPKLEWVPDIERAHTDTAVRIETDHMLLRGVGFDGMAHLKQARVHADVDVVLNPSDDDLPGGGPKQVNITCKGPLDFEYEKGLVTFHEEVHVIDGNGELFSDILVAHLNDDRRTIRFVEATGNVRIEQQGHHANSDRALYEPAKGKITLLGKPSLLLKPESEASGKLTP